MASPRYAELRCRSCFSFLEGASQPEELVARAAELGLSALALADRSGLYGVVRAHAEARRRGYPLLVGAELLVEDLGRGRPGWLTLLAQDREGYANLCRLLTAAHGAEVGGGGSAAAEPGAAGGDAPAGDGAPSREDRPPLRREKGRLWVPLRLLGERAQGLFALYAGADDGEVARLQERFGRRLGLTVVRHHVAGDEARLAAARAVGARRQLPVVVVNDAHTHVRRRQVLQDVLTCVRLGTPVEQAGRRLFPNAERTLKGPEEMARLWADFPEGLEAAAAVAESCRFRLDEIRGEHPLPPVLVERAALAAGAAAATSSPLQSARQVVVAGPRLRTTASTLTPTSTPTSTSTSTATAMLSLPLPSGERVGVRGAGAGVEPVRRGPASPASLAVTGMDLLRELVGEGARWRYGGDPPDDVARQLEKELELVDRLGYASYFLTVWDVVRFARERGILCQGRGSAANSAVCYVLGVTSIDPVRMGLLFERFISAERGEPPDIDVDFEHERREEVLQYVYRRYGRDHAGMVCEVITYRTRSALRDVGKALGLSLPQVDRLAKLVSSHDDPAAIADATLASAGLDPREAPRVRQVLALARELQGFPRHLSIHVGGFVVTRRPLCETVPIEPAAMPGRTIVQWDKDDLAELDLLKVDLLALGMLTALSRGLAMLAAHRPAPAVPDGRARSTPASTPTSDSTSTSDSTTATWCSSPPPGRESRVRARRGRGGASSRPTSGPVRPARRSGRTRLSHHPGRGPGRLRDGQPRRHHRGLPDRVARADGAAPAAQASNLLRPGHLGGHHPARADPGGHGPPLPAAARRAGAGGLPLRAARGGAGPHQRRAALPGAGHAAGGGGGRLHAG
jgi:error-prone DNA polymerase